MQRYGARIDGLFMDEGSPQADSQNVVDYPRLRDTIKAVNRRAVLIQNNYGDLYGLDMGMKEYFGQQEFAHTDGNLWPGYTQPVAATMGGTGYSWWAKETTNPVKYTPQAMFRYTVLQAATNTDGGGMTWAAGRPAPTPAAAGNPASCAQRGHASAAMLLRVVGAEGNGGNTVCKVVAQPTLIFRGQRGEHAPFDGPHGHAGGVQYFLPRACQLGGQCAAVKGPLGSGEQAAVL